MVSFLCVEETAVRITGPTIRLHSGRYFDFTDPEHSEFDILDIAHSLSKLCRFTGHCDRFYSVAQHSVHVSGLVPPEDALAGLLHDASEAFLGDVAKPLKMILPDYQALEKRVEAAVLGRFGLPPELPASVKHADLVMLRTEQRDLMHAGSEVWAATDSVDPLSETLDPWPARKAADMFLWLFGALT